MYLSSFLDGYKNIRAVDWVSILGLVLLKSALLRARIGSEDDPVPGEGSPRNVKENFAVTYHDSSQLLTAPPQTPALTGLGVSLDSLVVPGSTSAQPLFDTTVIAVTFVSFLFEGVVANITIRNKILI